MKAYEMWEKYRAACGCAESYEAWQYGCDPDGLAALTLKGIKTATASALPVYEAEGSPIPCVGGYSIILDAGNEAVCIIKTVKVSIVPFCDVTGEQAYLEGEGDRTLAFWRRVHIPYFRAEMTGIGRVFDDTMPVVCEVFESVYPRNTETGSKA